MPDPASLPRLAYIGEVPIRRISAGPALLYRLLESYPPGKLLVAETDHNLPDPAAELNGVRKERFFLMHSRLTRTRFARAYAAWTYLHSGRRARALLPALREFKAEAILTVAHGLGWIPAAMAARQLGVPLHLICHDLWSDFYPLPPALQRRSEALFGEVYRSARSRLTVSPQMEEKYRSLYGAAGTVLYPSRGSDALRLDRPPLRTPVPGNFVFAYAGSASPGIRAALIALAHAVAPLGAKLRIYQGIKLETLRQEGLRTDNVEIAAFRPAAELHRDLIASADAMYLPMSFTADERANVELCFPSKLSDYTVAGLPILVCAPPYATATHWAQSLTDDVELVTQLDEGALAAAAQRLMDDPERRHRLAWSALTVGQRMFSQEAAFATLSQALTGDPA